MKSKIILTWLLVCQSVLSAQEKAIWSKENANVWSKEQRWLVGSDFLPSTAINQLEMWQAETFDTATIDRELGWAEDIGMNVMRVYLHDLAWEADTVGFKKSMENIFHFVGIILRLCSPSSMIAGIPMPRLDRNQIQSRGFIIQDG